ncbi:MAG: ASKHA domain-containing protein, partial [Dehalococcoidia bacterium]|nr:ASKHA domain-containing protein [Dehalococcoidia bacterium]
MSKFKVSFLPQQVEVEVDGGKTIMDAARNAGVNINSVCGGEGVCGQCRVQVISGDAKVSSHDLPFFSREEIQSGHVLACQTRVHDNLRVIIPPQSRVEEEKILTETRSFVYSQPEKMSVARIPYDPAALFAPLVRKFYLPMPEPTIEDNIPDTARLTRELAKRSGYTSFELSYDVVKGLTGTLRKSSWKVTATVSFSDTGGKVFQVEPGDTSERNYGLAVDVGTTTVVVQLVHLNTGKVLGVEGSHNLQAHYGEDVLSRIAYACGKGSLNVLQEAVVKNINGLIRSLCAQKGVEPNDVTAIVAAGNTTMAHLLLGLMPCSIRNEPYVPTVDIYPRITAGDIGIEVNPRAVVEVLPSVSSYIGGDIVAGVMACGLSDRPEVTCLIDIGTNGEVVVGNNEWMVCCSASAGPAFEGAGMRSGMRATRGAIQSIQIAGNEVRYETIGKTRPRGICGSGVVDLIYGLVSNGIIDIAGKFRQDRGGNRLFRDSDSGQYLFTVVFPEETETGEALAVSQTDIDNVIRSKAAVYAAVKSLMDYVSLRFDGLQRLYVAGGFGNFLNIHHAIGIGLLPDVPVDRIQFIGNSSLMGARMALLSVHALE